MWSIGTVGAGYNNCTLLKAMMTSAVRKELFKEVLLPTLVPSRQLALSSNLFQARIPKQMKHKHWHKEWKPLRRLKVIKVELPNFQEEREAKTKSLTPDEMRTKLKEKGIVPPRPWVERQHEISSSGGIFEPYIPPEGDGRASIISAAGAKQAAIQVEKKSKSMMALRKIKSFEEGFDKNDFLDHALEVYKKMHEAMMTASTNVVVEDNERLLAQYVTEKAFPEIVHNLKRKTIRWKFLQSVEPPRLVHARCDNLLSKDNTFGQVTVRLHTKQTLAIYDRFGRLLFGNELVPKDVLEYVVFEKHLADTYGLWRVHAKIIPNWAGTGYNLEGGRTVRLPQPVPEPQVQDVTTSSSPAAVESNESPTASTQQQQQQPAAATATSSSIMSIKFIRKAIKKLSCH